MHSNIFFILILLEPFIVNAQSKLAPSQHLFSYLRCWRCDHEDDVQCVKQFDYTKYRLDTCDGKCLKAFEKVEARTKAEIDKAELSPTVRKCVSQKELSSLERLGINVKNGCHILRTAKRSHKLYCFCDKDSCNNAHKKRLNYEILIILLYLSYLNL